MTPPHRYGDDKQSFRPSSLLAQAIEHQNTTGRGSGDTLDSSFRSAALNDSFASAALNDSFNSVTSEASAIKAVGNVGTARRLPDLPAYQPTKFKDSSVPAPRIAGSLRRDMETVQELRRELGKDPARSPPSSTPPQRGQGSAPEASGQALQAARVEANSFKVIDTNGDGMIDREEWARHQLQQMAEAQHRTAQDQRAAEEYELVQTRRKIEAWEVQKRAIMGSLASVGPSPVCEVPSWGSTITEYLRRKEEIEASRMMMS